MTRSLPLALAVAATLAAFPAAAQDTQTPDQSPAETPAGTPTDAQDGGGTPPAATGNTMSMGQRVAPDGNAIGSAYLKTEHGDWSIRCIRTENGQDPCQIYQLLEDDNGNAVAEFVMFPLLPAQGEAVAGGNIISPLETLLPEGVTLAVDGGETKRYPFLFCSESGCMARVGYTQADIDRFKRGKEGAIGIVPVVAVDQRVSLKLSLTGFTAAYDQLISEAQAQAEAAPAAGAD